MSVLSYCEQGFCDYLQYEALSARRQARKTLHLPVAEGPATLYVLGASFSGCAVPLCVRVNDAQFLVPPRESACLSWYALELAAGTLRPGMNEIILWSDNTALDGWVLAMETGYEPQHSGLSLDGGETWRHTRMGARLASCGEYIVRARVADGAAPPPAPPVFAWEDPASPALARLRACLPEAVATVPDPWDRARALATWVSGQWQYRNTSHGVEYAPWDAATILAWGRADRGFVQPHPITMCVHYGVFFATAALALGVAARNVCCKGSGLHDGGHFVAEVWSDKWGKWCQVDANTDTVFVRDGVPLSVAELAVAGPEAGRLAATGPGFDAQNDYIKAFVRDYMFSGWVFEHWAVWPRNDYLSRPDAAPPSHGSPEYCETAWVWAEPARSPEHLGMFPHRVPAAALQAPPPTPWRCG